VSAELMQSLIAAGIQTDHAVRVAKAVAAMVGAGPAGTEAQTTQFSRPLGAGYQLTPGTPAAFSLYTSAPNTHLKDVASGTAFGPGGGALGVRGVSVFDGEIYCSETVACQDLAVRGDAAIRGGVTSVDLAASGSLGVAGAMAVSSEAAVVTVPLSVESRLSVSGGATLHTQTTLTGKIDIQGAVFWRGPQQPAVVSLMSVALLDANDESTIAIAPRTVTVLSDHGQGRPTTFKYEFIPTTKTITYVTEAVFDAETCEITTKTETIDVVTAVEVDKVQGIWHAGDVKIRRVNA
jgi:hypothetical protein